MALLNCRGYFTNTTQIDAYRGAGRPEAIFVLERSMDNAARELGVDPLGVAPEELHPRPTSSPIKTGLADTYDVGEFDKVLTRAEAESRSWPGLPRGVAASRSGGQAAGAGAVLLHRIDPGRSDRTGAGRL